MKAVAIVSGVLIAAMLGCTGETNQLDDQPQDAGDPSATDAFGLALNSADRRRFLAGGPATAGNEFIILDVTLRNNSLATPLAASSAFFSLATAANLVFQPASQSSHLEPACRDDVSVAAGGEFSCRLAFEIPDDQAPSELRYHDGAGNAASVAVPPPDPWSACREVSQWDEDFSRDWSCEHCAYDTECGDERWDLWDLTVEGPPCSTEIRCADECVSDGCDCLARCFETARCKEAYDAWMECYASECGRWCGG